ncbi:hypothetical protein CA13_09490 [Planctomycetes bacterium CA13]|uniref:Uncharacterized protein n=1 Tax=Novipirellula herctigrandis TaxID=2527986 RepID=A0A5C5YX01_9BACT|nr:hypothetical protein CA13_09490 [Planctomycetes bacterium CA13]
MRPPKLGHQNGFCTNGCARYTCTTSFRDGQISAPPKTTNQRMHAEDSSRRWAMVAFPLVPGDPGRYPINEDRYAGVGPWRHNTGLRLMPVNDMPDEPFPRTTFLVRPSNLLMACASNLLLPSACSVLLWNVYWHSTFHLYSPRITIRCTRSRGPRGF